MSAAPNLWLRVFAPFAAGYFFSYLLRNANAVIAPALSAELSLSAADLGLLTSAYLATFAAAQLPLGLAMDRFGPRRVESALLLCAALGCALFAWAQTRQGLVLGRALIGLGVSSCLMASFATFARTFGSARQASLNGAVMAAGATGALVASQPLALLAGQWGWRPLFFALALLAVLVAAAVWCSPEKPVAASGAPLRRQVRELAGVYRRAEFWIFVPQAAALIGGFMALQGLWAVPYLLHVEGLPTALGAQRLLLAAFGMLLGFLAVAFGIERARARGIAPERVLAASLGLGLLALLGILLGLDVGGLLWAAMGFSFSANNLSYACLQRHFPLALAGRVNTALNLMSFGAAFLIQWSIGLAVDALRAQGLSDAQAFRAAFGALWLVQLAGWAWYLRGMPRLLRGA